VASAQWNDVALNGRLVLATFDSDVVEKPGVHSALGAC